MASKSNSNALPRPQTKRDGKRQRKPNNKQQRDRSQVASNSKSPNHATLAYANRLLPSNVGYASQKSFFSQLMRQYVLPSTVENPILSPATSSTQLCPRIIKKSYVLSNADIDANGNAMVIMKPSIEGPAFVTTPGASTFPVAGAGVFSISGTDLDVDANGYVNGMFHVKDMDGLEDTIVRTETLTNVTSKVGLNINLPAATPISWDVKAKTKNTGFIPRFITATAGAWTAGVAGQPVQYPFTEGYVFQFAGAGVGFVIRLEDKSGNPHPSPCKVDVSVTFGDQTHAPLLTIAAATTALFTKFPKWVVDSNITTGRLCSMSLLVTNATAELKKQGEIYIGRLQPEAINQDLLALPSHIVAQPTNRRYIGPASLGGYTWWMPDDITVQEPAPIGEVSDALTKQEVLVCYLRGLDPASSFNIEFTWYMEFFTTNQIFEKRNTPPNTNWCEVLHALSLAPAATCNPDHVETFKNIVKKAMGYGQSAYEHYNQHKALYDMALNALMAL